MTEGEVYDRVVTYLPHLRAHTSVGPKDTIDS